MTLCHVDPDADGDAHLAIECGGDDCDDSDARRFPGNIEVCDLDHVDEDCDPSTLGHDLDGDGYVDAACCNRQANDSLLCGSDCDDTSSAVNPGAGEICNGRDDNCDGSVDEGVLVALCRDADGDLYGDPADSISGCPGLVAGYVSDCTDCNDDAAGVHPGATERCDAAGVDENCDTVANPPELCDCVDGQDQPCDALGVCAAGIELCIEGRWGACSISPQPETCNTLDDDCDGDADEELTVDCYGDEDGDGYALAGTPLVERCPDATRPSFGNCPFGTTHRTPIDGDADCDDADPNVHPGAPEICNRLDDDCSSGGGAAPEEDEDNDGHTLAGYTGCTGGFPRDDCQDRDARVYPGQTAYFTEPRCAPFAYLCECGGVGGFLACDSTMPNADGSCSNFACFGAPDPASFDFDCDGSATPPPPPTGDCRYEGPLANCGGVDVRCTGYGFTGGEPAVCGAPAPYRHCWCENPQCVAVAQSRTLPCR